MYIKQYRKVKWYKRLINKIKGEEFKNYKWIFIKQDLL